MELGEVPPEGWRQYLWQEEQRLLTARYTVPTPTTPGDTPLSPEDDAALDDYVAAASGDTLVTQLQFDWHQFVTLGLSPESRSPTPSPILAPQPQRIPPYPIAPYGVPLTRHASPVVFLPYEPPPPLPMALGQRQRARRRSRQATRELSRMRLRLEPLHASSQGRAILDLATRIWHHTPSGFAVTQFAPDSNGWRANDTANYLTWLERDIRVHRSTTHRLLCVENIDALNAVLVGNGRMAIAPRETPADWLVRWQGGMRSTRGLPAFLREGYSRRNAMRRFVLPNARRRPVTSESTPHDSCTQLRAASLSPKTEPQDAGQATGDGTQSA